MLKGRIILEGMQFHAFHGVYPEEKLKGNNFLITISFETDIEMPSETDKLEHTVDYASVYKVIESEMKAPSSLLEHLGKRILTSIKASFPGIRSTELIIKKLNPPMGGVAEAAVLIIQD